MTQGKINKNQIASKDVFKNIDDGAKEANASVKSLEITMKAVVETAKLIKSTAASSDPTNNKSIRERNELLAKSDVLVKSKIKTEKQLQNARLAELRLQKQREQAFDKFEKGEKRRIKQAQKNRKEIIDSSNAYKKLTKQVNNAQARFKRLAAQHGVNSKQAIKANIAFAQMDDRLRRINKTARDGRRDVGRYGLAFRNVGISMKSLFLAGGIVGVIRGIGAALGDAFKRLREFDKEMQNLSGISGITRKELKGLEKIIISVASGSIRTSNEVAKLATNLFALGKSRKDVERLLKPTNDLSIALNSTSQEAGELLVSTLNAFQKGADSGQHFADVIAKMRTSTSLDFERIKDSLGFVSATANVLNLSIGETGALIGVLQDNNFKAARAGRLLNSSFIKLAKEGKTLSGALDRINKAQERGAKSSEILRIAEKDFGLQSASLGVILASNRDRISELTNEFDNLSQGALKELTDTQLESLDAKFKILDSTWERFILSVENGTGVFSKFVKGSLDGVTKLINGFRRLNESAVENVEEDVQFTNKEFIAAYEERFQKRFDLRLKDLQSQQKTSGEIARIRAEERQRDIKAEIVSNEIFSRTLRQQTKFKDVTLENASEISAANKKTLDERIFGASVVARITGKNSNAEKKQFADTLLVTADRIAQLKLLLMVIEEENEAEEESVIIKGKNAKATRELTGLIEKQAKAVSDLNKQIKEATNEDEIFSLGLDLEKEKEELERLKRIYTSTLAEIAKIEIDLIKDSTDRRIEQEEAKSKKLIKIIITNSRITSEKRIELLEQEENRMIQFREDAEKNRFEKAIDDAAKLAIAEFDVTRSGFKSEKDFQEERSKQLEAIERNRLQARLDLLKFFGNEEDKLEIAQLEAKLAAQHEFEKKRNIFTEEEAEANAKAIQFTEDLAVKAFDARLERLEKEENAGKDALIEYKQASRDGNITAKESLAEQEQLAEESARNQQKIEQDKQNFLMVTAVLQAFNSELAKTDDVGKALTTAITSTTVLSQFASSLPAFLDGTENTGPNGQGIDGKGGFHAVLHPNEKVFKSEHTDMIGNFTNEEVAQTMEKKRMGNLVGDTQLIAMANGVDMSGMEVKLNDIKKAIIDKPENKIELGAITQATMEIVETRKVGNRTTFNRFKVKK